MDFSLITLLGGLALFLYGMNVMSDGLAKISGGKWSRFWRISLPIQSKQYFWELA